jgi:hypothetical protein
MAAGIGTAAQVFQVWWADPTKLFILKKLKVQCTTLTGFAGTSAGVLLQLFVGHNATADGTGGTAVGLTGGRMRAAYAMTSFATAGEIRISATAALTAATGQVLEGQPIGGCMGPTQLTNTQSPEMFLFGQHDSGDHPLVLAAGDALAILTLNPGATGTWIAVFTMGWLEAVAL